MRCVAGTSPTVSAPRRSVIRTVRAHVSVEVPACNCSDFGAHLRDARATARIWVGQAAGGSVPQIVGRPDSTLAKIVDEVLYLTCTRGLA